MECSRSKLSEIHDGSINKNIGGTEVKCVIQAVTEKSNLCLEVTNETICLMEVGTEMTSTLIRNEMYSVSRNSS